VRIVASFVVALSLAGSLASGQSVTPKVEKWNTIDRLCGSLLHVDHRERANSVIEDHSKPLIDAVLRLYARDSACCANANVLASATTGRGGKFEFKDLKVGTYWLVTVVGGQEYKMPLRIQLPDKSSNSQCSEQLFELDDSGDFQMKKLITVD
jgi:hypothetical protein